MKNYGLARLQVVLYGVNDAIGYLLDNQGVFAREKLVPEAL
jgi:hypothetical protein